MIDMTERSAGAFINPYRAGGDEPTSGQRPTNPCLTVPRSCPFCEHETGERRCGQCGRDVTAARKICRCCRQPTPSRERQCCHCEARQFSELRWRIPLILLAFLVALAIQIAIALLG